MTFYGYQLRNIDGLLYCNDGEFRVDIGHALGPHEERVRVFKSKASAAGKARFIERVTQIEEVRR